MGVLHEFKQFAIKGHVVDLAVGVIIGAAFGKIVASLVGDIAMPMLGTLLGGLDFAGLTITIGEATVRYGRFLQTCVDFLIVAWAIFLAVKVINRLKSEQPAVPAAPVQTRHEALLEEIRDLLKK